MTHLRRIYMQASIDIISVGGIIALKLEMLFMTLHIPIYHKITALTTHPSSQVIYCLLGVSAYD